MSPQTRVLISVLALTALVAVAGCQEKSASDAFADVPIYGDFTKDTTPVIAKVGDVEIHRRDLDLWLDELPTGLRNKYNGPHGERLAVKRMIDMAITSQDAVRKKLYNDSDVARTLISDRRNTLDRAMRNYGLLRDARPTEEEVRQFYMDNKRDYRSLGMVRARHIEVRSLGAADEVYTRLMKGGRENHWIMMVEEYSVNDATRPNQGEVGWFNKGSSVANIANSAEFTTKAYDLESGVNPPFKVGNRYHVVEILDRKPGRPMTFKEARDQVERDMLPGYHDAIVKDYLLEGRERYQVARYGDFASGNGLTDRQLFERALAAADPDDQIAYLMMIVEDFPDGDLADDALLMAAQVAVDSWKDRRIALRYLSRLTKEYPDSDLSEDAKFLKENLYNPGVMNPRSIEDLRKESGAGE